VIWLCSQAAYCLIKRRTLVFGGCTNLHKAAKSQVVDSKPFRMRFTLCFLSSISSIQCGATQPTIPPTTIFLLYLPHSCLFCSTGSSAVCGYRIFLTFFVFVYTAVNSIGSTSCPSVACTPFPFHRPHTPTCSVEQRSRSFYSLRYSHFYWCALPWHGDLYIQGEAPPLKQSQPLVKSLRFTIVH
jgi:hypothetical protein